MEQQSEINIPTSEELRKARNLALRLKALQAAYLRNALVIDSVWQIVREHLQALDKKKNAE